MKSPLRWPGGKGRLADTIISAMPEHDAYVEACCGGAAVFWAKPRDVSKAEILNDADGELINFYQVLHKRGRSLVREVAAMPYARAVFAKALASRPNGSFSRAVRFWYINRVSFASIGRTFGVKVIQRASVLPKPVCRELDEIIDRMRGVVFESVDLVRLITLYDRPDTVFYIDPPYWGITGLYRCDFEQADHARLADALLQIKGAFLLSYNNCRAVKRLYGGCFKRQIEVPYTIRGNSAAYRARGPGRELLISNRPLPRLRRASPK